MQKAVQKLSPTAKTNSTCSSKSCDELELPSSDTMGRLLQFENGVLVLEQRVTLHILPRYRELTEGACISPAKLLVSFSSYS